jgi:hypothetical protein
MGSVRRRSICVLGIAIAVAVGSGCGGGDDEPTGSDLTAIRCPLVQVGGSDRYEPAKDSFDTAELIGERFEDARATATEHGCEVVVAKRDGEGLPVPTDVDPTRIYVYTDDDVVTEIEGVGGGI